MTLRANNQDRKSLAFADILKPLNIGLHFAKNGKKVLGAYGATHFHFREFANKHLCANSKSPYYGWTEKKRDAFLYDLAFLCSESAVPVGGCYHAKLHHERSLEGNPYENTIDGFFYDLARTIEDHWPGYTGKVLFVFDRCDDERWAGPLRKIHAQYAQKDARFEGGLTFENDTDPKHLPLQAADLYAYVLRQHAQKQLERRIKGDESLEPMRVLDFVLNKNLVPSRRRWPPASWEMTFQQVREDQKRQKAIWAKAGRPNKQYYPNEHFPFEKYGLKKPNGDIV